MMVSELGMPLGRTPAPAAPTSPAPVATPADPATEAKPAASSEASAPGSDTATRRAEVQIRLAFDFGVRLSLDTKVASTRRDGEAIEAYENDGDEDDHRVNQLAKSMTKALGKAIHEGLKAAFGDEDQLSKADRKQLKELEHELKSALKDAFKSNRSEGGVDLAAFAADALGAVQNFAEGFGAFMADASGGVDLPADSPNAGSGSRGGATAAPLPAPFVAVENTPTLVSKVDPRFAPAASDPVATVAPRIDDDDHDGEKDHDRGVQGNRGFGGFRSSRGGMSQFSTLLDRITSQLEDLVASLQPNADPTTPAVTDPIRDPVVDGATPQFASFQAQLSISASYTFEASINLVA